MTPTARTLQLLRKEGWTVAVVEKWNPHSHIRQDLWGFADLIAMHPDNGLLLVQACMVGDQQKRIAKVRAEPRHREWLLAGRGWTAIAVFGWATYKVKRGGLAVRWKCTRTAVRLEETNAND
jgi:hypothetical protein